MVRVVKWERQQQIGIQPMCSKVLEEEIQQLKFDYVLCQKDLKIAYDETDKQQQELQLTKKCQQNSEKTIKKLTKEVEAANESIKNLRTENGICKTQIKQFT